VMSVFVYTLSFPVRASASSLCPASASSSNPSACSSLHRASLASDERGQHLN
jgi:hypothetical protein